MKPPGVGFRAFLRFFAAAEIVRFRVSAFLSLKWWLPRPNAAAFFREKQTLGGKAVKVFSRNSKSPAERRGLSMRPVGSVLLDYFTCYIQGSRLVLTSSVAVC